MGPKVGFAVEDVRIRSCPVTRKEGVTSMIQLRTCARVGGGALAAAVLVLSAYYVSIRAHVLTPSATKTGELLQSERFGKLGG